MENGNKNEDILNNLSEYETNNNMEEERNNFKSADHKDIIKSFHTNASIKKTDFKLEGNMERNEKEPKKYVRPVSSSSDFQGMGTLSKQSKAVKDEEFGDQRKYGQDPKKSRNYHMGNLKNPSSSGFKVGLEQQNLYSEWIEDISLRESVVIDAYQNN
jgi:hypothetical protein